MSDKTTTIAQDELVAELVETYNLSPEQIGFEGEKLEPILDFEAICVMREKLTDFKAVDVSEVRISGDEAEAVCVVINERGNTITVSDFAQIGELMPDGSKVSTSIQARRLARARAMRTSIFSKPARRLMFRRLTRAKIAAGKLTRSPHNSAGSVTKKRNTKITSLKCLTVARPAKIWTIWNCRNLLSACARWCVIKPPSLPPLKSARHNRGSEPATSARCRFASS